MRTGIVISLCVSGVRKVFRTGETVKETNFMPDHFDALVKGGHIKEVLIETEKKSVTKEASIGKDSSEVKEPGVLSEIDFSSKKKSAKEKK